MCSSVTDICASNRCTWSCGSCCRFATVNAHTGAALCSTELTLGGGRAGPPVALLLPWRGLGILTVQPSPVSDPNMMCWLGRLRMVVGVAEGLKPVSCSTHTQTLDIILIYRCSSRCPWLQIQQPNSIKPKSLQTSTPYHVVWSV